ncbi:MAG TPA: PqiA/YebS family transporter subunit [Nevskia sp.]|nr:PqiA/YebS family transporter subunit [Nevskia sp.]
MSTAQLIICECCDSVYRRAPLSGRATARCGRCGTPLYKSTKTNLDHMLALTLAALPAFLVANAYPLMTLEVGGRYSEATLWGMIVDTYDSNVSPLAVVAALTVFFFPLLQIGLYAWVLIPLRRGRVPVAFIGIMHALRQMQPWTMVEVFVLGLLVAVVKLGNMATSTPDLGMWGFAALTLLLTMLNARDLEQLWERAEAIGRAGGGDAPRLRPQPADAAPRPAQPSPGGMKFRRGRDLGLIGCKACGLVLRSSAGGRAGHCPRCDHPLHRRKPDSHARTWALLIAAMILYIPANALPVMHTATLFDAQDNTILSGVVELWKGGAWDLAVIVFTASIAVPLIKMACLALLLLSSRAGSPRWRRQRTRIYRMVEFIGRWSMLDVFVVALLLSLVRFGLLAEVKAGPGIVAFCAVVVLTMLASMSFDPRLIWDAGSDQGRRRGTGA